jgi:hypothetical protein
MPPSPPGPGPSSRRGGGGGFWRKLLAGAVAAAAAPVVIPMLVGGSIFGCAPPRLELTPTEEERLRDKARRVAKQQIAEWRHHLAEFWKWVKEFSVTPDISYEYITAVLDAKGNASDLLDIILEYGYLPPWWILKVFGVDSILDKIDEALDLGISITEANMLAQHAQNLIAAQEAAVDEYVRVMMEGAAAQGCELDEDAVRAEAEDWVKGELRRHADNAYAGWRK